MAVVTQTAVTLLRIIDVLILIASTTTTIVVVATIGTTLVIDHSVIFVVCEALQITHRALATLVLITFGIEQVETEVLIIATTTIITLASLL